MARYAVELNRTASATLPVGSISADATRPRRGRIYDWIFGSEAAAADNAFLWQIQRHTAPRPCIPAPHGALRRRAGRERRSAGEMRTHLEEMTRSAHLRRRHRAGLRGIGARHDELVPVPRGVRRREQQAAHGLELSGETQLAVELARHVSPAGVSRRADLTGGQQNSERDRQIEATALLGQIRGRETHRDAAGGEFEVRVEQRRAHPLLALLHHHGGEAHDAEHRQAAREAHFDVHQRRVQSHLSHGHESPSAVRLRRAPLGRRPRRVAGGGGPAALQGREPRLERFEPCPRALEHARLGVELVPAHQVELAQALAQHGAEVALEVLLHAAQRRRHALEQTAGDLIDTE